MTALPGQVIVDCGIVSDMIEPATQVQPCGVDLTIGKIDMITSYGVIDFDNKSRKLPGTVELWNQKILHQGCYLITLNETVSVPKDCLGIIRPRSSLLRMGASIESALWDAGYVGKGQVLLVVHNEDGIMILPNARIAQIIFIKMDQTPSKQYNGRYQNENL